MKLRIIVVAGVFAVTAAVGVGPAFAASDGPKVTICHGSADHYVQITVDANAVENGHSDGSEPAHGTHNLPDKLPTADGSCSGGGGGGGGGGGTL